MVGEWIRERSLLFSRLFVGVTTLVGALGLTAAGSVLAHHSGPNEFRGAPLLINLSWRTSFWRLLGPHLRAGFASGYGPNQMFFKTGNRTAEIAKAAGMELAHAHNGFLDSFLEGGVVLAILVAILTVHASWRCGIMRRRDPIRSASMGALVMCALTLNITEPDFFMTMRPTLLMLALVASQATASAWPSSSMGSRQEVCASPERGCA